MRFTKLELTGELNSELPLHHRMTVVSADGEAERRRLAEALAGRAEGVVWAFDDEDSSEEQVPIEDFAVLGLPPHVASAMLLRTHDIPAAAVKPVEPEPAEPDVAELEALAAQAAAESQVRAELEARRARLAARQAPVAETATQTAVARALTELRAAEEYAAAAADDAWRIRDEWNELATALATPAPSDEALAAVEAAREALARRREELEAARLAVGHGPVSPENAAVIGHLHTEVTNAQARADRPFPGSAARRRLAEAEEAEAKFLQELGFPSYTAYLLDTVINPADPEPLRRISNAERAVAEAEVAWQNVAPIADELYVHQSLQRQATRLQERAAALLGFDPGNAVGEHLADWPQSYARLTETRTELQRVLAAAGIASPDLDPAATAETWLADRQAEASEYAALEAEVADSEAELAALQRAAADRAARAEARLAEAAQAARNAEELLDAYLLDRLTAHRSVGPIGSLPLILEDAFADLDPTDRMRALAQLAETSATVQIIYVTSDPEVLAWATTVRSDQIEVKRPEAVVPSITPPPVALPAPAAPVVDAAPAPAPFEPPAPAPAPFVPPAPAPPAPAPYVPPTPAPAPPTPAPVVTPAPTPAPPPPPPYVPPAPEPAPYVAPAPTPAPPPPPPPYEAPAPAPAPIEEALLPMAPADSEEPVIGRRCMECRHDLAIGECHQCRHSFCGDHLVRMKRASRPPLCLSCALVAAGARRGRR